jgi:hypothetical protein
MTKDVKLAMITSSSLALDYLKANPNADIEEIMKHVIQNASAKGDAKIAGIAAANHVIKYKQKNWRASSKEIMQNLTDSMNGLLMAIQE